MYTDHELLTEANKELRELTDAFCSACTALSAAGIEIPIGASAKWAEHQAKDAARKKREQDEAEWRSQMDTRRAVLKEARVTAMNKLTPEERDALGLR